MTAADLQGMPLPGALSGAPAAVRQEFARHAAAVELPAGREVILPGQQCAHFSFVLRGVVRVYLISEEGREITLYRIAAGESCVLTAASLLGGTVFPASAVVEEGARVLAVPAAVFREWVDREVFWRTYVFQLVGERMSAVLARLEEAAFVRVASRLAAKLLALSSGNREVRGTHQSLASDLGTAREVVSRELKRWEKQGWVRLHRGRVEILDRFALERLSPPVGD